MSAAAQRHGARRNARGFTLIEVLLAMAIMTVGAMGVLGFQRHVARANRHARNVATATQIAENWLERFRADALLWSQTANRITDVTRAMEGPILARTQWLNRISGLNNQFQTLPVSAATPNVFNAADIDGIDMPPSPGAHSFCVSYRLNWVRYGSALRVDVRVWWRKDGVVSDLAPLVIFDTCADTNTPLNPGGVSAPFFHIVYMSTTLRGSF